MKRYRNPAQKGCLPFKNQKGFALLLSLLVILLLSVLVLEDDFHARADLRAAGNFRDDLAAFYLARSAIYAGEAVLREDMKEDLRSNERYDGLDELWAYPISEYSLGDGTLTGSIVDETGKININQLVNANGDALAERVSQLRLLFEVLKLHADLASPIVDFLDKNDEPLPAGAEDAYYRGLHPSYRCKNGPLDTLEELHMVKGITDDVYRTIAPYLTIYGDTTGLLPGKINVNTADIVILQSLNAGIDESEARRLVKGRPYKTTDSFKSKLSRETQDRMSKAGSLDWIETKSDLFSIRAEGKVNNTKKIARAVVSRANNKMELQYFKID